jgi:hypothetical protein
LRWRPVPREALVFDIERIAVTSDGVTFFHVAPPDGVEAGLKLAREWRPDIVHLHLTSATNGVLPAPGFCDRGFGDCRCRLGRPVAYFDGTLKIFHQPYLPAIRNASVEPLPDRPGPRAQFERRRDEFLPRDLTLLHAAGHYTM